MLVYLEYYHDLPKYFRFIFLISLNMNMRPIRPLKEMFRIYKRNIKLVVNIHILGATYLFVSYTTLHHIDFDIMRIQSYTLTIHS